jgi:cell division protein FtsB
MRFRFTIRDLLWLTVVAAIGFGWWVDHGRVQAQNAEIQAKNVELEQRIDIIQLGIQMLKEHDGKGRFHFGLKK